jgi:threonine synthase
MERLECPLCSKVFPHDLFFPFCPRCLEPGLVHYEAKAGPRRFRSEPCPPLERFREFLPLDDEGADLSLGEGDTPLLRLAGFGAELKLSYVYAKNEAQNPTGSFKDRGTAVVVRKARAMGFERLGTVSTGNMAASTAAYGSRAGLDTSVLLKEGTPASSLRLIASFRPRLFAVTGDYAALYRASFELGRKHGIYFANSTDPFRMEGYKCTGFETFLQLGGRPPDLLIVPVSSGGHFLGLVRAFEDLVLEGLAASFPVFVGVQASGCSPLVRAFNENLAAYERLDKADTIAHAISNPAPPAGNSVLLKIRQHRGLMLSVSDDEMVRARSLLAGTEGLLCQLESASAAAALTKLAASGLISKDHVVVLVITGSGLKLDHQEQANGPDLTTTDLDGLRKALE